MYIICMQCFLFEQTIQDEQEANTELLGINDYSDSNADIEILNDDSE